MGKDYYQKLQIYINPIVFGKWTYRNETQNILIRGMDVLWIQLPVPDVGRNMLKELIQKKSISNQIVRQNSLNKRLLSLHKQ